MRKLVVIDTEPTEHIAAVLGQRLVVSNEVVVEAARLTQLVHRLPVTVERSSSSWVDDVPNKFPKRHRTAVSLVLAIFTFDVGCNPLKIPDLISAKQ